MLCTAPELSWWDTLNTKMGTHTLFLGLVPTIPRHPPNKYLAYLWLVRQLLGANAPPIYTACQVLSMINCQGSSALVSRPPPHWLAKPTGVACRMPACRVGTTTFWRPGCCCCWSHQSWRLGCQPRLPVLVPPVLQHL